MTIPWSEMAETRIRGQIYVAWFCGFLSFVAMIAGLVFGMLLAKPALVGAGCLMLIPAGYFMWLKVRLVMRLGWEEEISAGRRIPGDGMLANKPRDTSRLTIWNRVRYMEPGLDPEEDYTFVCTCGERHTMSSMQWIPNIGTDPDAELEGSVGTYRKPMLTAVDAGGGRYVKHCKCGIGHYALR